MTVKKIQKKAVKAITPAKDVKKATAPPKSPARKKPATAKKAIPAKKAAPAKKSVPAKKAAPAKKSVPAKKKAPVKKATPAKKVASAKKPVAARKVAATKKPAAPARKAVTAKKTAAAKNAAPVKKSSAPQATAKKPAPPESAARKAFKATLKQAAGKKPAAAKRKAAAAPRKKQPPARVKPALPAPPAFDHIAYLEELDRLGIKLGLGRIQKLLTTLGNPEKKLKVIHVVGTNGKSSTARMISAILAGQGLKAGTYLSPHLVSFNERFLIGVREISDQRLSKLLLEVKKAAEEVNKRSRSSGPLTQFEILTAAAFLYFRQQKVDVAVVEAGLGGRYDATNVMVSRVQVFTNAELEHTDLLGDTVEEIVREKAAVFPEKGNVVLGTLSEKAAAETMKICKRKNIKALVFGEDYSLLKGRDNLLFDVWTAKGQYGELLLSLFGQYQRTNCAVAIQAAELFMRKPLDEKKLRRALPGIKIPARMEIISEKPMVILDGAHNPSGIEELLHSLASVVEANRTICVVSILKGKDAEAMLGRLLEFCDILFITENSNPRCAKAQELAKLPVIAESSVQTFVARDSQSALESAFKLASIRDVILVTGSLYLLADIKKRMA